MTRKIKTLSLSVDSTSYFYDKEENVPEPLNIINL